MVEMRWASAVSRWITAEIAIRECAEQIREELGPGSPDLLFVFISPRFADAFPRVCEELSEHLSPRVLAGCSAAGVVGGGEEIEHRPAVSLVAARLPGVEVLPFRLNPSTLPDLDGPPGSWHEALGVPAGERHFVLLADPFTFRPELLAGLDYAYPGPAKIGGLASGSSARGGNALFLGDRVFFDGTVGVALSGDVEVEAVASQGCRPVGPLMRVTRSEGNIIYELDGTEALEALRKVLRSLDGRDRELARTALYAGIPGDEFLERPGRGDFLIRDLIGADPNSGAIAVSERVSEGARLRLHLRDAASAAADLREALGGLGGFSGALLFSCVARGRGLYGRPGFETGVLRELVGDVPAGGCFSGGEIGPAAGGTRLHAYSAVFGLFRPASGP